MMITKPDRTLDSPLGAALDRLRIPELWHMLGLEGKPPARDGKACRSPFRQDRHPSFSIHNDGRRWKDHATGESGDAADFLATARNLSKAEACRELIRLAGIPARSDALPRRKAEFRNGSEEEVRRIRLRATWPEFNQPSQAEIRAIASLRSLSEEGVSLAAERGLLFTGGSREGRAWMISDRRRKNAQGRRMDGKDWERIGAKAWTLPGSIGALPIGLCEAQGFPNIALVEGGPDLLAAFHVAWCATSAPETLTLGKGVDVLGKLGVVAILGTHDIPEEELRHFAGKRVRIFADADHAGQDAKNRWWRQLRKAGAKTDSYSFAGFVRFDGKPVKDLNDFVLVCPDQWEAEREAIEEALSFSNGKEPS
jgi:CHC2 zinc finger/Toprim-like